ncbi:hypothetical protein GALL_504130 [mine drainage metagenome]|uniref:Uncharacterized protein n=1 Tax=mine drainage metagenome TaxID=410659 RepID=A0A1J5PB99_9ZZZZ
MLAADLDAERLRLEAMAVAGFAGNVGKVLAELLARPFAFGLAIAAVDVGDDALERFFGVVGTHAVFVGEFDLVFSRTMQDRVLRFLRQVLPFGVERELVEFAKRGQRLDVIGRGGFRPRRDRALAQGQVLVGNDQIFVDVLFDPEAAAGRAGAVGVVERKESGLDFRNGETRNRAGEFLREQDPFRPALVVDFCDFLRRGLILRDGALRLLRMRGSASPGRLRSSGTIVILRSARRARLEG